MDEMTARYSSVVAFPKSAASKPDLDGPSLTLSALGAALIIALPALFWISAFELVNYAFALGLSASLRTGMALGLIAVLSFIWATITASARQRMSNRLSAELERR